MNPSILADHPEQVTRILFQGFPHWWVAAFYLYAFAAVAVFAYGWYVMVRKYRRGRPEPLGTVAARLWRMATTVLSHRTIKRRDKRAGVAHSHIFYGFGILFIGTCTITLQYDILEPLTGFKFWYGEFYLWFSLVLDIAGAALIGGLVYMMYRRRWLAPPKLDYARPDRESGDADADRTKYRIEDWAFLWTLILIAITGFLLEAARLVWLHAEPSVTDYQWWSPVGALLAKGLEAAGLGAHGGGELRLGLWWFHGLLALTFIALIPYTKVKHVFNTLASLTVRDPLPMQRLPAADLEQESIGYGKLTDFQNRFLLQVDACTKCGRCHEACPARAAEYPLSPRDFILTLRELAHDSLEGGGTLGDQPSVHGDGVNQVRADTLWSCRTCAACVEICPVGVEHVPMIVEMRRALVENGQMDSLVQTTLQNIQKKGNSFGENKRKRPAWTKKLDFKIKDARKEEVDVLWFVGDYASFDPRYQKVSQAFARILHDAGVDFGILYEGEMTAGNDVRRVGEEGLYQHLVESNIETLGDCRFRQIVTTDPHSFNTIKNEYPEFGGRYTVEHASTFIQRMLDTGQIRLARSLDYRVTYHDPCHLGRYNKGYDAPRSALRTIGCELVEMERSRDNSFCCGAGGGRIWTPDPPDTAKVNQIRVREAAEIEQLEVLVVNCPKCMNMMEDGVKTAGYEGQFVVKELIELVAECMDSGAEEIDGDAADSLPSATSVEVTA